LPEAVSHPLCEFLCAISHGLGFEASTSRYAAKDKRVDRIERSIGDWRR
jgi:hypothetical protein